MKRIFQVLIIALMAFVCSYASADSRTYYLYLGTADSGNTTVPSGVSNLFVQGHGFNRSQSATDITGLEKLQDGTASFQVVAIGTTPYATGAISGISFTVRYRERIDSGVTWSLVQSVDVLSGMLFSGNSLYEVPFFPNLMGEQRWELVTGVTSLEFMKAKIRYLD